MYSTATWALGGAEYTIADIATFPGYGALVEGKLYDAGQFLDVASYNNVTRWAREISERPAVKRGRRVNRTWGEEAQQLPERHSLQQSERHHCRAWRMP